MYYLFVDNLGTSKCVSKNVQDIYSPNMNISCYPSLSYPSNVKLVRENPINCTGTGNGATGTVYCDFITATILNLV